MESELVGKGHQDYRPDPGLQVSPRLCPGESPAKTPARIPSNASIAGAIGRETRPDAEVLCSLPRILNALRRGCRATGRSTPRTFSGPSARAATAATSD